MHRATIPRPRNVTFVRGIGPDVGDRIGALWESDRSCADILRLRDDSDSERQATGKRSSGFSTFRNSGGGTGVGDGCAAL